MFISFISTQKHHVAVARSSIPIHSVSQSVFISSQKHHVAVVRISDFNSHSFIQSASQSVLISFISTSKHHVQFPFISFSQSVFFSFISYQKRHVAVHSSPSTYTCTIGTRLFINSVGVHFIHFKPNTPNFGSFVSFT